jgi:hypothetical protein
MTLLIRDDNGFLHPVQKDVRPEEIPEMIAQAKSTCAALGKRFGYEPPPIEALRHGRMVAV